MTTRFAIEMAIFSEKASAPTSGDGGDGGFEIGAALSWGRERPRSYFSDAGFNKLRFCDLVTAVWI